MSDVSDWRCPNCHSKLHITNSGDYRCPHCQVWHPVDKIDPMGRDWKRNQIVIEYALEKALNTGVTL